MLGQESGNNSAGAWVKKGTLVLCGCQGEAAHQRVSPTLPAFPSTTRETQWRRRKALMKSQKQRCEQNPACQGTKEEILPPESQTL